jgi:lactaldehyde reductase
MGKAIEKQIVTNRRSYHGKGAIQNIAHEIKAHHFKKAFVCSDPGLIDAGVTDKVLAVLRSVDCPYFVYSEIHPNPTIINVQLGLIAFGLSCADVIIAVGGGSAIDTAKAIALIARNPEYADIRSVAGAPDTQNSAVFYIAVPTTAGTAAEATSFFVITDPERSMKLVGGDFHAVPEVAVVDPDMMASMPPSLRAATGMDALTHAIEAYVCRNAWSMTDMLAIEAVGIIAKNLRSAVAGEEAGREGMALGQYLAGEAFNNCGLGLSHAMAHSLGGLYDTPHGLANAIILPTVMEFNASVAGAKYKEIARVMGAAGNRNSGASFPAYKTEAAAMVRRLAEDIGIPATLRGILKADDIEFLSRSAISDFTYPGNPRPASLEDIKGLYRALL